MHTKQLSTKQAQNKQMVAIYTVRSTISASALLHACTPKPSIVVHTGPAYMAQPNIIQHVMLLCYSLYCALKIPGLLSLQFNLDIAQDNRNVGWLCGY